jgi:nitrite reductase/ring-hydroxylating ferredoxin subunit
MPEAARPLDPAAALPLCASAALAEAGRAHLFDVQLWRWPGQAFALRYQGRVVAYLNRCAHVPTTMDHGPGEFLDDERRYIVCPFHGAAYEPSTGLCVAGPCRGERLRAIDVFERDGQVYWYPSDDVGPAAPAQSPASGESAAGFPTVPRS